MQVILLEKINKLGKLGDVVNVKNGFARNYLIPQAKAKFASKENIKAFEEQKLKFEQREREILKASQEDAEKIKASKINIAQKAGVDGKLFGSVTSSDVSLAIKEQIGLEIKKTNIKLHQQIKSIGEYKALILLHQDVHVELDIVVSAQ